MVASWEPPLRPGRWGLTALSVVGLVVGGVTDGYGAAGYWAPMSAVLLGTGAVWTVDLLDLGAVPATLP